MLPTYKSYALYSIRRMLLTYKKHALVMLDARFCHQGHLNSRSERNAKGLCRLSECIMHKLVYG